VRIVEVMNMALDEKPDQNQPPADEEIVGRENLEPSDDEEFEDIETDEEEADTEE